MVQRLDPERWEKMSALEKAEARLSEAVFTDDANFNRLMHSVAFILRHLKDIETVDGEAAVGDRSLRFLITFRPKHGSTMTLEPEVLRSALAQGFFFADVEVEEV